MMKRKKVVFTEIIFPDVSVEQAILDQANAGIVVGTCKTEDDVIELARDADALVAFTFKPVSDSLMSRLTNCKLIVRGGIGVDTIDIPAATKHGIIITNIPGYCAREVSDLAIAMMMALLSKLPVAMRQTARGGWDREVIKPLRSLWKLTVGIIGFGNIGRLSAKKAASHGMNILFYDPFVKTNVTLGDTEAQNVELEELFRRSDAILLHAPATDKTFHIINKESLKKIKPGCVLVNTARGQLVDTPALVEALEEGTLGGAGLDLIENVPPLGEDHPLLKFQNVVITPYYGWYTEDSSIVARETIATEILRVLTGYYPNVMVNPDVKRNARAGELKPVREE